MAGSPWVVPMPPPTDTSKPLSRPSASDRHEPQVVGKDVDVVRRGHGKADLELPRQIGRPVERLLVLRVFADRLRIDPNLAIGTGPRQKMLGQFACANA